MNRPPEFPKGTVPAGATHFYHNPEHPKPSTFAWRKQVGSKWFMFKADEWIPINGNSVHMFVPIGDVLRPEPVAVGWDGVGEPPIGALVEFDKGGEWVTVTVFAVKERTGDPVDVLFDGPEGWGVTALGSPRLRPVRTAEQAYRDEQVTALAFDLNYSGALDPHKLLNAAQYFYDRGWRRTEVQS